MAWPAQSKDKSIVQVSKDGGTSDNSKLMQFQAEMLQQAVIKSDVAELSAMGSVYMGGLGIGFWSSPDEIAEHQKLYRIYEPNMDAEVRDRTYAGWKRAVLSVLT
jgi:glycerol kinase